jgi:hypothetical protein
MSPT